MVHYYRQMLFQEQMVLQQVIDMLLILQRQLEVGKLETFIRTEV